MAALREAIETGTTVVIGYVDNQGASTDRVVDPVSLDGGSLTAHDHRSDDVRTFAVHRITTVRPLTRRSVRLNRGLHPVRRGGGCAAQRRPLRGRRAGGVPRRTARGSRSARPTATACCCASSSASCGRSSRPARPGTSPRSSSGLNGLLARHPITPQISDHDAPTCTCTWGPARRSVAEQLVGESLLGLSTLVCDLGADRLGVCSSPPCTNAFVDASPNRSRRYCSERCSSRANVAAYRARRRAVADGVASPHARTDHARRRTRTGRPARTTGASSSTPVRRGRLGPLLRRRCWTGRSPPRSDDWVTLRPPDGVAYLAFHLNEHHVRPVWPSTPDQPQQQLHLDFEVEDLERRGRARDRARRRRRRSSSRRTTYG